jgi:glycosyltransferase involved in cell wall biosynthesis
MNIVLVINERVPVVKYGGTERVVTWLSDALAAENHNVYICAPKGSSSKCAEIIEYNPKKSFPLQIPSRTDIVHWHVAVSKDYGIPSITTFHWIAGRNYQFPKNVVFLSKHHARFHNSSQFVYNGLDPCDYIYSEKKDDYFLFLSKASRSSKGVDRAIQLAKRMGFKLLIAGGYRLSLNRNIKFLGEVGGRRKAELLAHARGLIFPIRWDEPFGLVTIEAMVSGTPVISTPCGAVPEIVTPDVGFICKDDNEMENAVEHISEKLPQVCRNRVMENFTSQIMARNYLSCYNNILSSGSLELKSRKLSCNDLHVLHFPV